jgi:hypothetical protein
LRALGHEVRLMPAQYVKAYIRRNKHDAAEAEAICEAVGRPTMRFVPVKTADQQAAVLLHRGRDRLVRQRTGLVNASRRAAARQARGRKHQPQARTQRGRPLAQGRRRRRRQGGRAQAPSSIRRCDRRAAPCASQSQRSRLAERDSASRHRRQQEAARAAVAHARQSAFHPFGHRGGSSPFRLARACAYARRTDGAQPRSIRKETSSLAFGIVGRFGGSSAGFVVAALNAACKRRPSPGGRQPIPSCRRAESAAVVALRPPFLLRPPTVPILGPSL